jgi:hypothetical protein
LDNDTCDPTDNRWYCYKTTDGKFGWIKVRDTEMLSMEFDWTTW